MSDALGDIQALVRLRLRLLSRLLLSGFTTQALRAAPARLAVVLSASTIAILAASWILGFFFVRALLGHPAGPFFLPAMSWAATTAAVGIFFYAALTLSGTLTHRNELTTLLLAPLSPRVVLADRLLAVSGSFTILLVIIGLPNLFGAGQALGVGAVYMLICLIVVLLLPVTPVAAGLLLVVLVLRFAPPRHARVAGAIVSAIAAGILYLVTEVNAGWNVTLPSGTWLAFPLRWPGAALSAAGSGHDNTAVVYLAATACFATVLGLLAVNAASRFLASGWATYTEVGHSVAARQDMDIGGIFDAQPLQLSDRSPWPALFRKEWLVLRRDPKLLAQLAYPLLLEGFTLYKAIGNPFTAHALTGRLERLFAASLYLSVTLTALFLLTILALPMMSREGRSLYLIGISPLRARDVLIAKIVFCAAPILALLEAVLLTIGTRLLRLSHGAAFFDALVFAALMVALAGWLVCVGVVWPRLSADGSRRQIHATALLIGPTSGAVLCAAVGWLLGLVYTVPSDRTWVAQAAGLSIFLLTGLILAGVLLVGPPLLRGLLTGDRRPA